jgi:cytochrome P450
MTRAIAEEVDALRGHIDFTQSLDWPAFSRMWWRIIRRITLGDSARNDEQITTDLNALRARGNVSYLAPKNRKQRTRFINAVRDYLERAEPGSLAAMAAATPAADRVVPEQQLPQWLFAFDAGSWATFRALSLLAVDPDTTASARAEARDSSPDLPHFRATMLESLRLWPTTPMILRDTRTSTTWRNGRLQEGTSILIFAPFFHRDDETLSYAHQFHPGLWLADRAETDWPFVPFSGGPGLCPGRNVVLLTASAVLAELLRDHDFVPMDISRAAAEPLDPENLPGTLSPFSSRFTVLGR